MRGLQPTGIAEIGLQKKVFPQGIRYTVPLYMYLGIVFGVVYVEEGTLLCSYMQGREIRSLSSDCTAFLVEKPHISVCK